MIGVGHGAMAQGARASVWTVSRGILNAIHRINPFLGSCKCDYSAPKKNEKEKILLERNRPRDYYTGSENTSSLSLNLRIWEKPAGTHFSGNGNGNSLLLRSTYSTRVLNVSLRPSSFFLFSFCLCRDLHSPDLRFSRFFFCFAVDSLTWRIR